MAIDNEVQEPALTFVDREQHRGLCFSPHTNFEFARKQPRVALARHEVMPLLQSMPVLLCRRDGLWSLLGCMGLVGTGNLMIGPQGGWMGAHVPDKLRLRPFCLAKPSEDDPLQLAYRGEGSVLLPGSERQLVDDAGEYTEFYNNMVYRLKLPLQSNESTQDAAAALFAHDLLDEITDSPLLIPENFEGECFTADMRRVRDLSKDAIYELIDADTLSLGYEIFHSRGNVQRLRQLALQRSSVVGQDPGILQAEEDFSFNFD